MNILALDPATKCGWAHSSGPSGTWDLSIKRDESAGMRLIRFRSKLEEFRRAAISIDLVVFEAVRGAPMPGRPPAILQTELQGVLKLWCEDRKIPYRGYSQSEIKKRATGNGNAKKVLVLEAAQRRWPNIVDDNHADALWLLDLAQSEYQGV
jgi:crossover junction endodeoxyribonuclease RuvC